ncbi:MAG TPA: class I SAM-dependent methyltransferase [Chloroflexota bacterium]|nr:class I SAM-dependent methyltransferase [Chloroflexota bacterium]
MQAGHTIRAADKPWNSPTTLYLARRLHDLAGELTGTAGTAGTAGTGEPLAVLDLGCGDGTTLEHLLGYGFDLYGCELSAPGQQPGARLRAAFGETFAERIRLTNSERCIPFEDRRFDVVYASQVFEHVKFLDAMVGECARVLRPHGVLLTNFPLATYPVEWHLKIPLAHWLPPGPLRVRYLWLFYALGLRPTLAGSSARLTAISQDAFLRDRTYYRFVNEVRAIGSYHFHACELETGAFVQAKLDLLSAAGGRLGPGLGAALQRVRDARPELVDGLVTYLFNAAFCMRRPRTAQG